MFCAMALLNLTISTDVLTAGVCKGINNSKIIVKKIVKKIIDNNNT